MIKVKCQKRYKFLFKLSVIYFLIQNITRTVLILKQPTPLLETLDTFVDGFMWDLYAWLILSFPLLLLTTLFSEDFFKKFNRSKIDHALTFIFTSVFSFIGLCEVIFWNEFKSRFNFIAVDYLIYTNEVLANLRESYPMGLILFSVVFFSLVITIGVKKFTLIPQERPLFNKSTSFTLLGLVLPALFFSSIGPWLENHDEDFHDDQLSRNGIIEFARAYRSNKIDYKNFYPTLTEERVNLVFNEQFAPKSLTNTFQGKRPNVVFIVVESLGAKFIATLDGQKKTTPYLNQLSEESIFFENLYATGTRTVRGLEAINLSVPPTPGYAVVKRPEHKNLFSLGNTFKNNGYSPVFMYGGNGFFDNMNSFFSGNGFEIVDKSSFNDNEVTFSNAWGVCDEDLFSKARQLISDKTRGASNPLLLFMLTTSNHRPFTYPDGKIDIPSGNSRAGAVKYTDFAIGKFLEGSKKEDWFKNTVFVIVADHSTEGRGRFDLEMADFHIPMWIYSPQNLKPERIMKLSSQIDILPSLIDLLNLKDNSPFFGQSIFNKNWKDERAFIGNYQFVGYYKNKVLTTLGPNKIIRNFSYDPKSKEQKMIKKSNYVEEAISYYQKASNVLDNGNYQISKK